MTDTPISETTADSSPSLAGAGLLLTALLAACGGGEESLSTGQGGGIAHGPQVGFIDLSKAELRRDILLGSAAQSQMDTGQRDSPKAARTPTANEFFDWAEALFPDYFPGHQTTVVYNADPNYTGLVYRLYPATGNYLVVYSGICFAYGPIGGGKFVNVGMLPDYATLVAAYQQGQSVPFAQSAARFLLQAQFSASEAEIASVQSLGYSGWLDQQFASPSSTTGWDWLMSKGYNDVTFLNTSAPADFMMWQQLIASPDALRKRVALALSEIFVVSTTTVAVPSRIFAIAAYWDVLSTNAFGNFRNLLEAVTLNPAMGYFLNTKGNQKANPATGRVPDENYAREVLQLFSIGLSELNLDGSNKLGTNGQPIDTYDQTAITSLATVFTGWDFDPTGNSVVNPVSMKNPMRLTASLHSTVSASFLGATVPANTAGGPALKIALDAIFNHVNVGPFIAKQLIQRLVTSNPSANFVRRVAAVFNNNGSGVRGDLKATVRAILLDADARDDSLTTQPSWGKLREPMVRFVQWARTFNAASASGDWKIPDLSETSSRLGQSPLRAGSVFNFFRPGYIPPNTVLAKNNLLAPEFQIANESTVAAYINYMVGVIRTGVSDVLPNYTKELSQINDTTALVDRLNLLLCANAVSAANLATIKTALGSIATTTVAGQQNRVYAAVLLMMAAPQYLIQK